MHLGTWPLLFEKGRGIWGYHQRLKTGYLPFFFGLIPLSAPWLCCYYVAVKQRYIYFSPPMYTSPSTPLCILNFFSFSCISFLPCLCVPVKMRVGTETEKFWDSLWALQAECTGLLWVERHPWARGDLGQSARTERTDERGPIWTRGVRNIPIRM